MPHHQKLNSVMDCECCCCEQPISKQNFLFTVISLDAHNNNIRNPSQNSASAYCTVDIVHELQVQHGFTHHSLEEVDVGEPNFDVRLEAVLENLVKLGDPPRHGVVDLLLLV